MDNINSDSFDGQRDQGAASDAEHCREEEAEFVQPDDSDNNPLLDALLNALDDEDQNGAENVEAGDENERHQNQVARRVSRHLSSSSAKRRMVKESNCHFCREECTRLTLEHHLQTNPNCLILYSRKYHLKSVDAIILKIYPCLYCDQHFRQLSHHLQTQPECFQQFKEKFNVNSLGAVMKKVKCLKKQEYKSRQSLDRRFQNCKAKDKKKAILKADKVSDLNRHCHQTTFSNYKRCCNCNCDLTAAEENRSRNRSNEIYKKMAQFGRFCLFLSFEIPVDCQTVATRLLQRGFVVTTDYNGEPNQELNRTYFVHQGHSTSRECDGNSCQKITLNEYLDRNPEELQLTNENVTTYICSVDKFINSFISNIVTSPGAPLSAQEYHFRVKFNDEGIACLEGLIWARSLQKINLLNVDKSLTDDQKKDIKLDYLEKIKSSIASTSDIELLKTQFNLTDRDCERIQSTIARDPMHYCGECFKCKNPPMPSLETLLCVTPDDEDHENILVSERFVRLFKSKLRNLEQHEIEATTTLDWIQSICYEVDHEIIVPRLWRIDHEGEVFTFRVDRRLADLIEKYDYCVLLAAYHYSISCVYPRNDTKVILERTHISDCFFNSFNPFIAKAASGSTNIQIIASAEDWNNLVWSPPTTFVRTEQPLIDHKEVSITEALVLLDNNKLNIKASSVMEFVYSGPNFQKSFKQRNEPVDNCFTTEYQQSKFYECLETMVSRFLQRMNGNDLLLCEVATSYDYLGSDKSDELFEVYRMKIDKIMDTDEQCITTGSLYPEYILCDFGDFGHVLKKRRRQKVLNYPEFDHDTHDFKHSQVLLYSDVQNINDLSRENVEEAFDAVTNEGERVIDRNKRIFLMKARAIWE